MSYFSYSDLLKSDSRTYPSVFVCRYRDSLLVGPKICSRSHLEDLKCRLLSSSFINFKGYKDVTRINPAMLLLIKKASTKHILEVRQSTIVRSHFLMAIPKFDE